MFRNLDEFLNSEASLELDLAQSASLRELHVAAVSLLCEIASSDQTFSSEELARIMTVMFTEFGLSEIETGELVEISQFLRKERGKLDALLASLNAHLLDDHKVLLLAMIWRVVMADNKTERFESEMAAQLRKQLGLSLEQAFRARQMAQEETLPFPQAD